MVHVDAGLFSVDVQLDKTFNYLIELLLDLGVGQFGSEVPFAIELGSLDVAAATFFS
jgi:hypothetical protein